MGKTPDVGFLSDTEQSTFFLRSIQEPALISQAQSLLVSIINENKMQPVKLRGRAQLPSHLKIAALSETIAQTIQPLDNDLDYSPSANRMQTMPFYGPFGISPSPYAGHPFGMGYPPAYYRPTDSVPYSPDIYEASANQHVMQGYGDPTAALANSTERRKGSPKRDSKPRSAGKPSDKPQKPKVTCQACYMNGHEAVNCWALARALLTQTFIRNLVDKTLLDKVKENYKLRFQPPENARANRMCHDTLWTYCADNKISAEQVCQQMNWNGFADSRNDSDLDGDSEDDSSDDDRESNDQV
jgi:hypothetical protein